VSAWRTARLDECCKVVGGATPKTSVDGYWGGDIRWATPQDLSDLDGPYIEETKRNITRTGLESCAATLLPAGSVLLSSRAPIGYVALNTVPMATNQGFKSLVPNRDCLDPKFLYYWLRANRAYLEDLGNGATFKELSKAVVSRIEVPTPPLPDQKRIAEILDRTEALRYKRRQAITHLDSLNQAIFNDLFGDPATNPKGFPTISLGELGEWRSGGTPPRSRDEYFGGTVPWFSSGELNDIWISTSREHISEAALRETSAKRVPKGALMLGMYDTAALKSSIAAIDCSCNQAVAFAVIKEDNALTVFVYFAILIGRAHFRRMQRGVRQKNLNLSMVRGLRIPLPPLGLQREFAQCLAGTQKLQTASRGSLVDLSTLFTVLEDRAFRRDL
jgi:type I restriction enzyme, S subunit